MRWRPIRPSCGRTVGEWYTSVVKTRMHNFSGELIVFTRWHEEDLIGTLYRREPFVEFHRLGAARYAAARYLALFELRSLKTRPPSPVDPREPGEALWEELHGAELLRGKRRLDPVRFEVCIRASFGAKGLLYGDNSLTYEELPPRHRVRRANYTDTADTGDDYLCSLCYVGRSGRVICVTDAVYSARTDGDDRRTGGNDAPASRVRAAPIESNNGGRGFARAVQALAPEVRVEFLTSPNKRKPASLERSDGWFIRYVFPGLAAALARIVCPSDHFTAGNSALNAGTMPQMW